MAQLVCISYIAIAACLSTRPLEGPKLGNRRVGVRRDSRAWGRGPERSHCEPADELNFNEDTHQKHQGLCKHESSLLIQLRIGKIPRSTSVPVYTQRFRYAHAALLLQTGAGNTGPHDTGLRYFLQQPLSAGSPNFSPGGPCRPEVHNP